MTHEGTVWLAVTEMKTSVVTDVLKYRFNCLSFLTNLSILVNWLVPTTEYDIKAKRF